MRTRSIALLILLLTACTAPGPTVIVQLEEKVTEDSTGIPRNEASLKLTGGYPADVPNPFPITVTGDLQLVNPASYPSDTVALLATWWGGAGDEIRLRIDRTNDFLMVEQRSGDETNTCTSWEIMRTFSLPPGAQIKLVGFGEPIEHSSLAFCDTP